jgi:hypothetical protein
LQEILLDVGKNYPKVFHLLMHRTLKGGEFVMSSKTFSILVRCWYDQPNDATQIQVLRADTSGEIHLEDSSYLLRISLDEVTLIGRCFIRHLASGREAYVQGGPNLNTFIKDCLLKNGDPGYSDPGPIDENETIL